MKTFRVFFFTFILSIGLINAIGQSPQSKQEIQKLVSAMQIIDLAYVDSVDMTKLVSDAIEESLKELDPHSSYIPKEEVEKANEPLEGSFDGIGVTFQLYQDTILIISPVPGGPSEKLGILAGDKIVKINGEDATGSKVTNEWVMEHLRGKRGTAVDVSIYRNGRDGLLEYTIIRDKIPMNSIDATFMAGKDIGYIRLNRFSKTSQEEFDASIMTLREQGMTKLILDLRGNSGGYLNTAVDLSDEFLGEGKLIVYTEGLHSERQDYIGTVAGNFEKGDLIILIDEASASASEIVSGAVQDWDRGIIVGRRSFGKGLVQRPFNLPDGSVIRLTTARYYTPTGRCIQRPYDEGTDAYYEEFRKRYQHGEYVYADSIKLPDSLKFSTPRGRIVYGGGGIMPDVFIPLDTTMYTDYFVDLRRKGVMNDFTLDFVEKKRLDLYGAFPTLESFINGFTIDEEMQKQFIALGEKKGVKYNEAEWNTSKLLITTQLKALIARNLWDISAYYQIMSPIDDEFKKAVEILQDEKLFHKLNIG
jgi:carboxyl-terminal processing protease